ncbi:UDP-N-acetylmuramyl peptide synthase [Thermoanaerobacterium thermosaccharolyticum]|uniref:Lipid II isoglutaminyl synthase (glutamine-hydrolyzing) subunit MurT n=1 Tax=Thermoanaerobacterium thermosaccharolyticum TaxID=1517 RepID=A0A231VEQ4_THETR|nr:Mur ligase family protein [Thermoanaerobacterium thermosaccharolyticum]OXT06642.1 UDP-N-acetylmuramyl peptide synthase [Thermoanaerobacterium thermosaccharolyticum]
MDLLGVVLGKFVILGCKLTGKNGTSLPGKLALKISPNLIKDIIKGVKNEKVVVTGTNGKTTTSGLIAEILKSSGKKVVHNREGANMLSGIATVLIKNSDFFGNINKDTGVFEVDEANMPLVLNDINPKIVVVTNFFRDQLDRYGELDITIKKVKESLNRLPKDSILLLNADEPFTASLGDDLNLNVMYYGILDKLNYGYNLSPAFEQKYCPVCGGKYVYKDVFYGQLGDYYCPKCGKSRPNLDFGALDIKLTEDGISFKIKYKDKLINIKSHLNGAYNIYNVMSSVATNILLGIPLSHIQAGLNKYRPIAGRLQTTYLKGKKAIINLIKNPIGFDSTLNMLREINKPLNLLIAINDNYADGRDVSWLWDVDIENFVSHAKINYVVTSGLRAEDMALRLKYAGIDPKKIKIINSIENALDYIPTVTNEELIAVLPNYTSLHEVNSYMKSRGVKA